MNIAKAGFDPKRHNIFTPKFPQKYTGQYPIIAKSSWERTFAQWCDVNESVIQWASETIVIPYFDTVKNKNRRYYPDFMMEILKTDGKKETWVVEIKPYKETIQPVKGKKKSERTLLYEAITWRNNVDKWDAAQLFCKKRGYGFKILTERDLFK